VEYYPSPCNLVRERAADERAQHRRYTVRCSSKPKELRTHLRGGREAEHGEDADGNTSATQTGDCASDDQRGRAVGECTHKASDLKHQQGDQEPKFDREVFVHFSPGGLEAWNVSMGYCALDGEAGGCL
jgi:hypothetical protein